MKITATGFPVRGEAVYSSVTYLMILDKLSTPEDAQDVIATDPVCGSRRANRTFCFIYTHQRGMPLTDADFSARGQGRAQPAPTDLEHLDIPGEVHLVHPRRGWHADPGFPNLEVKAAFHASLFSTASTGSWILEEHVPFDGNCTQALRPVEERIYGREESLAVRAGDRLETTHNPIAGRGARPTRLTIKGYASSGRHRDVGRPRR